MSAYTFLATIIYFSYLVFGEATKASEPKFHLREERPKYALELMIAADHTMVKFYGDKLNDYLDSFANVLNGIFQDPSLETPIEVTLVKKALLDKDEFHADTMAQLGKKFTAWNEKQKSVVHYDEALLLTRNGCKDGCKTEGISQVATCSSKATSVSKDHGLMSALNAAHEIGHSLGLSHDGDENGCKDGTYIMSTKISESAEWSKCSSNELAASLRSSKLSCLKNLPKHRPVFDLVGKKYNRDQQCHFTYGPNFKSCQHFESQCYRLVCQKLGATHTCETLNLPAADGSSCGTDKWCIHGKCVPDGNVSPAPAPVDGGWSTWGDYGTCSRKCGTGVQWRERTCTNPKASHGGKKCEGEAKGHYRTCNTDKCEKEITHPRLEQCRSRITQGRKVYSTYYDRNQACKLLCTLSPVPGQGTYYFGNVEDGTHCYPTSTSNDVCIKGKCESVGCDQRLHSGAVKDRCGVCNGDGTTCQLHTGKNMEKFANYRGYHFVTRIPAGAVNFQVTEMAKTYLGFLAFKVGDSPRFAIKLPAWSTIYNLDGTKILFHMNDYKYKTKLNALGKIDKPVSIYYYNYFGKVSASKGIEWQYYGKVSGSPKTPTFKLVGKEWSNCSATCAGGTKTREVICVRTDDNSQVGKKSCSHLTEIPSHETCNTQNCLPVWEMTEWTPCSKTCGTGTQSRKLVCTVATAKGKTTVKDDECQSAKVPKPILPQSTPLKRDCNAVICYAKWNVLSQYGECSATCGGGKKTRKVECQHITKEGKVETTSPIECYKETRPKGVEHCNEQSC